MAESSSTIDRLLRSLYVEETGSRTAREIAELIARHPTAPGVPPASADLCERDALLITYADQVREPGAPPLQTLAKFCERHLHEVVSGVHILPFYPWTSDDGFSVTDYSAVHPNYGSWADLKPLRIRFDLMFDAVFNHLSAESGWFQKFLRDEPDFRDFFVTVKGNPDLSRVIRPRALPLLTEFQTARGPEKVWTTFSADQVDVNAKNPRVLVALLEALLLYVARGARFIRLDAIAYLWKEIGTPCIHLPQTHAVIQLLRAVLDRAAPGVRLITETNVPHADNISYFGDGTNEAQLVYNFALPPLVLHALLRGDATYLTRWAATLRAPSKHTTFFNFLASHDGIGLNPARGILPETEIDHLVERCLAHGGFISHKHNSDGSKSPYEMNIVYFDALNNPAAGESLEIQVDRFLAAQAIMLALAGVPGIYFHSLFGSRNDREAALTSGINRRVNRQKLNLADLETDLANEESLRYQVFSRFRHLLQVRRTHPAFSPQSDQQILDLGKSVFAVQRTAKAGDNRVLCLHNLSGSRTSVEIDSRNLAVAKGWNDLLADGSPTGASERDQKIMLEPYQVKWLAPTPPSTVFPNRR